MESKAPARDIQLIEASAGTGKTHQITELIAAEIIERNTPVEALMVVTFTEQAAKDMRVRIRGRLRSLYRGNEGALNERARRRLGAALLNFEAAAIGTIHSIAHSLLQTYSFEHQLECPTAIGEDEEGLADRLAEEALLDFLAEEEDTLWHRFVQNSCAADLKKGLTSFFKTLLGVLPPTQPKLEELGAYLKIYASPEPSVAGRDLASYRAHFIRVMGPLLELIREDYERWPLNSLADTPRKEFLALLSYQLPQNLSEKQEFFARKQPKPSEEIQKYFKNLVLQLCEAKGPYPPALKELPVTALQKLKTNFSEWLIDKHFLTNCLMQALLSKTRLQRSLDRIYAGRAAKSALSFEEILTTFAEASSRPAFQRAIHDHFRLLFVDEFQDTNPLQWEALERLFRPLAERGEGSVVLVGDPKQSIYRFRGGDLDTYIRVKESLPASTHSLGESWRAAPALLLELNRLFAKKPTLQGAGVDLIEEEAQRGLDFPEIRSPQSEEGEGLHPAFLKLRGARTQGRSAPLQLRSFNTDQISAAEPGSTSKGRLNTNWLRQRLGHYAAAELLVLSEELSESSFSFGDCAIIVATNKEAHGVRRALSTWSIPSALLIEESLWATEAAQGMIFLMEALLSPEDEGKQLTLLASSLFGLRHQRAMEEARRPGGLRGRLRALGDKWRSQKSPLILSRGYAQLAMEGEALKQLFARESGHELLLHLRQLAAELQRVSEAHGLSVEAQLAHLKRMYQLRVSQEGDRSVQLPERERVDFTLAPDVVQITTIHSAKGLEFPFVFYLSGWRSDRADASADPMSEHQPISGLDETMLCSLTENAETAKPSRRYLYLPSKSNAGAAVYDAIDAHRKETERREGLRKLYVAFTRASERLYIYLPLANTHVNSDHQLLRLFRLQEELKAGTEIVEKGKRKKVKKDGESPSISDVQLRERLREWADAAPERCEYKDFGPPPAPPEDFEQSAAPAPALIPDLLAEPLTHNSRWNRSSFSGLFRSKREGSALLQSERARAAREEDEGEERDAQPITRSPEEWARIKSEERAAREAELLAWEQAQLARYARRSTAGAAPLLLQHPQLPRGAKLGNLLHEAFEHWDAAEDPEGAELRAQLWPRLIQSRCLLGHYRRQTPPPNRGDSAEAREDLALLEQLRAELIQMVTTPFGGPLGALTLGGISRRDTLRELEFELPVGAGLRERGSAKWAALVSAFRLGLDDDPAPHREQLSAMISGFAERTGQLSGFFTGSIDLCFRAKVEGAQRYFIADYKSNLVAFSMLEEEARLEAPLAAYQSEPIGRKMIAHSYHVQAHLYLVGLHRYLRQRLGDTYDYDQHIGGYYYFFCRAMIGPAAALQMEPGGTPESLGVFFYRPPRARIEALSRFFAETSEATEQEDKK